MDLDYISFFLYNFKGEGAMKKLLEWYIQFVTFFPRWLRLLIIWGIILQISILGWMKLIRE
ncbi:hypothetical protein KQ3_04641 [Bacillus cereus B5-2]|nr:hypothetical protein ICS_00239 [Bacillus cereus BAG2O-3]EOQ07417.1 hypothetical protein KQ3_04641 [Bacillus cereus B5-2]EOQ20448.1 hypothetical protein KQ1_05328 [Bacillus cereus BAG3O-1]